MLEGKADALVALAQSKTELHHKLQFHSDERQRALNGLGILMDATAIAKALTNDAPAMAKWDKFLQLAAQVQKANERNGHLIQERMLHNHQALNVLMQAAQLPGTTYGPDGQTLMPLGGRHLGSG